METGFETWTSTEFQLNISHEPIPVLGWHDLIPDRFRVYSEVQVAHDIGLQQLMLRMGPIWDFSPHFSLASHLTVTGFPGSERRFNQELRLELEPSFSGAFLPLLRWSNRHRLEYRMRPDQQFWRYRMRLGLSYQIPETPWTSFISNETHVISGNPTSVLTFNQNRTLLGIAYQLSPSSQISLSYLNRLIMSGPNLAMENGLFFSFLYSSREEGIFHVDAN
jgi:hypothetical protein